MDEGKIIVRTNAGGTSAPIGRMYKIMYSMDKHYVLKGGWYIDKKHARFATKEEIKYFEKGAKHIKDIKKFKKSETADNYSII